MKKDYEKQIQKLLKKMTLEEKVGQLQQCGPSLVGAFEVSFEELLDMMFDGRISQEEFDKLMGTAEQDFHEEDLRAGRVGSYNGIGDADTVNRLQKIAVEETRLGIPLLFGYDVIHGFRTVTPIPLAESCAWEPALWEKTARVAAEEATAAGVHLTFAPMVDVAKDARWGRVSEGAGEDALLNSAYGAAKVKGFQGDDLAKEDAMAACVKHFVAYGAGEAGRDYNRVDMSMQRLWEEYMPPYQACIEAGARAVMPAFNDLNGVPCTVNSWLLRDVLREKWQFDGLVISDSNAIAECVAHGIAADKREAAKQAVIAGMDMDMSSNSYIEHLKELVESSEVEETVLDEAVGDVLRIKFELGLFDNPYRTDKEREQRTMLKPEYRALAREAAGKSIVLLKNENSILPLASGTRIGVFGSLAADKGQMTGAWAIGANPDDCVSLTEALEARKISYRYSADSADMQKTAEESDVLVAVLGEMKEESGEAASRAEITLPPEQLAMVRELAATGKPVIAVLFNGRPLAISQLDKTVPAIVEAWHLGVEAGNAVLDVLLGDVNPSGKLTTTFPAATGQCPMYYAHTNTGRPGGKSKFTSKYLDAPVEPLYPFGYGLSYTSYSYKELSIAKLEGALGVTVTVRNTGEKAGDEIVQCYVQTPAAKRVRPVRELKAFAKVTLKPGEEKAVTLKIPYDSLGYYDWDMKWTPYEGKLKVYAGGNVKDTIEGEIQLS
ncbi:MAG: glycoside hydrolase family 3 N-terminal domain-containing protein [Eubacteriales bacterium]|nr:glycoside hydrolase family 3 N-terminal domain-containing protein [Eubacteriales bacterium]